MKISFTSVLLAEAFSRLLLHASAFLLAGAPIGVPTKLLARSKGGGDIGIQILDEEATISQSTFPIAPSDLIRRCQEVIAADLGTKEPERYLSPDFEFVGPTDGPLGRTQYASSSGPILDAIKEAYPDVKTNYYNFHVDPFEPNRVWYTTRAAGTMTGTLVLPNNGGAFEANNEMIEQAPQATSMTFNENGLVTELTAGFVIDRRYGNTKGVSAVYAVFAHVGLKLPFPEARPFKPSFIYRLFQNLGAKKAEEESNSVGDQFIYWWRKDEAERMHSKAKNKFAVDPILKDI